jgi:methionyl-tRNA formyltransferase
MPSFWVLKNNEEKTGVSVFYVDEGIDSGPIIIQKEVLIGNMTQKELIKHTKQLGMDAIVEALVNIKNNSVNLIPNPQEEMTYFSFPTKEDVKEFRRIGKKFY